MSSQQRGGGNETMSLAVSFAICALVFIAVCVMCCKHHSRIVTSSAAAAAAATPHDLQLPVTISSAAGLRKSEIALLPTFAYTNRIHAATGGGEVSAHYCAVCLSPVGEGETVRQLPRCRHMFHVDCVDMWLFSHATCPLCRCEAKLSDKAAPTAPAPAPAEEPRAPQIYLDC